MIPGTISQRSPLMRKKRNAATPKRFVHRRAGHFLLLLSSDINKKLPVLYADFQTDSY